MVSLESPLGEQRQVTITAEVRTLLGLKPRDRVVFEIDGHEVKLRPARSAILASYGAVTPITRPEDFRKVREQFEEDVAANVMADSE